MPMQVMQEACCLADRRVSLQARVGSRTNWGLPPARIPVRSRTAGVYLQ